MNGGFLPHSELPLKLPLPLLTGSQQLAAQLLAPALAVPTALISLQSHADVSVTDVVVVRILAPTDVAPALSRHNSTS
jgi:hypothetical protein